MKFITVDQFKKADKKVQKAILDWWKPSVGDLYCNQSHERSIQCFEWLKDPEDFKLYIFGWESIDKFKERCFPLLTEGQLREFIEDKTDGKIDTAYDSETGYDIQIYNSYNKYRPKFNFVDYGKSLLQALWQVVCEIVLNTN